MTKHDILALFLLAPLPVGALLDLWAFSLYLKDKIDPFSYMGEAIILLIALTAVAIFTVCLIVLKYMD